MFKFLKEKLKKAISRTSEKIEEEGITEEKEVVTELKPKEKKEGFLSKIFHKKEENDIEKHEDDPKKSEKDREQEEIKKESAEIIPEEKRQIKEEETKEKDIPKEEKKEESEEEEAKLKKTGVLEDKELEIKEEREDLLDELEEKQIKKKPEIKKEIQPIDKEAVFDEIEKTTKERKEGLFQKISKKFTTKKINEKQFEDIFFELEIILLENNVAVEVIDKIKKDLKDKIVDKPIPRKHIEETITDSLKKSISELFVVEDQNLLDIINTKQDKPFVIAFLGINGSGKTTTIAKVANLLLVNRRKVVLAAADTFRAAAIDQLKIHADNLGVKLIKHDYGSDPAAVSFDAIKHAKAKDVDVVLIDTAGRIHSNSNLMEEMKKIIRVAKPDMKIFVGEAITGNDCTEQAKRFDEAVGIDGIILTKADIDEKGGASISVSYVTKKPILYLGVGQEYKDIKEFNSKLIVENLGL